MSLKHAFTSVKSDGGDATLVKPSDWNADHVIDASGATLTGGASAPSAPSAGNGVIYAMTGQGLAQPAWRPAAGGAYALQSFLGQRRALWFLPLPASTSLSGSTIGGSAIVTGTAAARTPGTSNMFSTMHRLGLTSSSTAGNRSLLHFSTNTYIRGNASGIGGFHAVFRFGSSDAATVANANQFAGMSAATSVGAGSTEPSAAVNIIGVGYDSTETVLSIMHNDGSGTATKVSLGANFPTNTLSVDAYELTLFCAPNASEVEYKVVRLNTGDTASGTISTNLLSSTQQIFPLIMRGNMSTALAVGLDIMTMYVATEV